MDKYLAESYYDVMQTLFDTLVIENGCNYNCENCNFGIYRSLYDGASCAVEAVQEALGYEVNK